MVTLRQVAAEAAVHIATASAVLNQEKSNTRVAAETRARVLAVARRLGYVRNETASRLRSGRSNSVGFVGGDFRNPFFAELISELEIALSNRGRHLVVTHVNTQQGGAVQQAVSDLKRHSFDSVIYWDENPKPIRLQAGISPKLLPVGFTTVARRGVWLDLGHAMRVAVEALADRNLVRLAYFFPSRQVESPSVLIRRNLFEETCREFGLPAPQFHEFAGESWDINAAVEGADLLVRSRPAVDAVIAFNDVAALGVLLASQKASSRLSVIAFDGTRLTRCWPNGPAYLDLKIPQMVGAVVDMIAQSGARSRGKASQLFIKPELVWH